MSAMARPWLIVARREIAVRIFEKSFIVSTLVTVGLLVIGIAAAVFFSTSQTTRVAVTDEIGTATITLLDEGSEENWEAVQVSDPAAARAAVAADEAEGALVKGADGYELITNDALDRSLTAVPQAFSQVMLATNAQNQGVDLPTLLSGTQVIPVSLEGGDEADGLQAYLAGVVFSILFFMTALVYGIQIAGSVVKEKESRVIEILSAAVPTTQLLIGKVVGVSALALLQVVILLTVGIVGLNFTPYSDLVPQVLGASGWFIVFFIVGFLALSCLWAAAGAMATTYEDLNQTSIPLNAILTGGYFASAFTSGTAWTVLSYVPIISSLIMPQRLIAGAATWYEAAGSLALTIVFTVVAIRIGSALYRRGIMQTSGTMSWRQAFASSK